MTRTAAVLLAFVWLLVLLGFNLALFLRSEGMRYQVDQGLRDAFQSRVVYGSFEGGWPGSVILRDVRVFEPQSDRRILVSFDRVRVDIDWSRALLGRSPVSTIHLFRPRLSLEWDARGEIYLPSPLKPGSASGERPRIHVQGLHLTLVNSPYLFRPATVLDLRNFDIVLLPRASGPDLYSFQARIDDSNLGDILASGRFGTGGFTIEMTRRSHRFTPWLREALMPDVAEALASVEIDGDLELHGEFAPAPTGSDAAVFRARADLNSVQVRLPGTAIPIENLSGTIRYGGGILEAAELRGEVGGGFLDVRGRIELGRESPRVDARGRVAGLQLTDEFVEKLASFPDPLLEAAAQLAEWRLRGPVNVDFTVGTETSLASGANFIRPSLRIQLRDNVLTYAGFPYTIRNLSGDVDLNESRLVFASLSAASDGMSLQARGEVGYAVAGQESWSVSLAARSLRVDEQLIAALDPALGEIARDLHVEGRVGVHLVANHRPGRPERPPAVTIDLNGLSIRPRMFPLAFDDVRGRVFLDENGLLKADGLSARHGGAEILVLGQLDLDEPSGAYSLQATVKDLPLDADLGHALDALDPDVSAAYRSLGASGRLALASMALHGNLAGGSPEFDASLHFDGLDLKPGQLPVEIKSFSGRVEVVSRRDAREIVIPEGATAAFGSIPLQVSARFVPGRGYMLRCRAHGFAIDDRFIADLGAFAPALLDPGLRPRLDGRGVDGMLTVMDEGGGLSVAARIDATDLTVELPFWTETRLERVRLRGVLADGLFRIENLAGEIPRPASLPPLPLLDASDSSRAFRVRPAISVELAGCEFRPVGDRLEFGMSRARFLRIPLEPWVLDLFAIDPERRRDLFPSGLSGMMDLSVDSASVGGARILLNGGTAEFKSLQIAGAGSVFVERCELRDLDLAMYGDGRLQLGGPRTMLLARNCRVFSVPVPRLEAMVSGDRDSLNFQDLSAVILGYEDDGFVLETAGLRQLRDRAERQGYATPEEAALLTDPQLREIITRRERFDVDAASRELLRQRVVELGLVSASRARRMDTRDLRTLLRTRMRTEGQPLGVLSGENSHFGVSWSTGRFWFDGHLDGVRVPELIRVMGGTAQSVRGRLKAWLSLDGYLADADSWNGTGSMQAAIVNPIELPLFLSVMKALDFSSWFQNSRRAEIVAHFSVRDRGIHLTEGRLASSDLDLILVPPGRITFGGVISAAFDVRHKGGIPLVSDLLDLIPSLILSGVTVQGPLENPTVTVRSLGLGSDPADTSGGRKPRLKEPERR